MATPQMTAAEMQKWIQDHERQLQKYAAALDPIKLRDVTKSATKKVDHLSKETIIEYLQNPTRYTSRLINASWYLYYRNQIYQRLITYFSTLFCLEARSIVPKYDLINPESDEKILRSYNDTLQMLNKWNIINEFIKTNMTCFIQDVSFNCAYYDETGLYLLPLPIDRCKIYGQYYSGDFAFDVDMSYFNGANNWLVDVWGEPFRSMFNEYKRTNEKWQPMPDRYAACFKYHNHDWETIMPPFSGLFGDLLNLNDISDIAAVAEQMEIYKLVYMKLKTITGAKSPDEWEVTPETVVEYFERLIQDALPEYASGAIVPGNADLGVVDFSSTDKASETNKVLKATKSVLNTSGGAQILNSADITGSTAFNAAIRADIEFAISTLLPQINGWINRILPFVVSDPSRVHFYHVGRLNRDEFRKELLENAQYSLPTKLAIMTLCGLDELSTLSLNHLEEKILNLGDLFNDPLKSSYTASDKDVGRPSLGDDEISDDGEASRDKVDRAG